MNATRRVNRIAAAALLVSLAGAVATLHAIGRLRRDTVLQEVLYLRSPKMLKRMCLGYTGLLADIYWTRAVQYFGYQHHQHSHDFHLLAPLLQITAELDPRLVPAYQFGSNFLAPKPPNGAGMPAEALRLAKYGVEHNPDQWRLYYNLGFLYYLEFKDYAQAADAFARGAQLPIHNEFMPILAARMAQHAGEFDTARMLWRTTYESTKDEQIRRNAVDHLRALRVDEDVTLLEQVVERYRQSHGHWPHSIADLESAGFIRGTPVDPTGHPYKLMPDGRIEVADPDSILFITKGLPPGAESPQPKPASAQPVSPH
jgi:tetratricopeptide (TPR) repeat protein